MCTMQVFSMPSHYLKIGSSLGYVLGAASESGKGKQDSHSEDREGGEEPAGAWVQPTGQVALLSF